MKENAHSMCSHFNFQYTKRRHQLDFKEIKNLNLNLRELYSSSLEKKGTQVCRYLTSEYDNNFNPLIDK
jgi:hypothetical protein